MLVNVLPRLSIANHTHLRPANAELIGEYRKLHAGLPQGAHLADSIVGQLPRLPLTNAGLTSALGMAVSVVVTLRAKKEVLRVHTASIVATVKDAKTVWNWPDVQFPTQAMGAEGGFISKLHLPIAITGNGSLPFPASRASVSSSELPDESQNEGAFVDNGHVNLPNRLAGPRMFPASRGHLVPLSIPNFRVSMGFSPIMSHAQNRRTQ